MPGHEWYGDIRSQPCGILCTKTTNGRKRILYKMHDIFPAPYNITTSKMKTATLSIFMLAVTLLACNNGKEKKKFIPVECITDNGKATGAVIVNAQNLVRICNSRPQRILPSSIGKPERMTSRTHHLLLTNHLQNHLAEWASKTDTSPFLPAVSSDYFVFALRRLLC